MYVGKIDPSKKTANVAFFSKDFLASPLITRLGRQSKNIHPENT